MKRLAHGLAYLIFGLLIAGASITQGIRTRDAVYLTPVLLWGFSILGGVCLLWAEYKDRAQKKRSASRRVGKPVIPSGS